jgi:hypothetical protein
MRKDLHGLTMSTDSGTAVDAFDRATLAYPKYRTDAARHLGAALKADPQFALGHVLRGYFNMLAYNKANIQGAAEALAEARKHAKRTTTREAARRRGGRATRISSAIPAPPKRRIAIAGQQMN